MSLEPYLEPSQVVRHLTTPVRRFPIALLFVLSLAMAFAVFSVSIPIGQADLEQRESRNVFLLIVGAVGLALLFTRSAAQPGGMMDRSIDLLAILLPSYVLFQLLPLPVPLIRVLSPARAELLDALNPLSLRPNFAPLSVASTTTAIHFALFCAYAIIFFAIREIARANQNRPWLTVIPILVIGIWQSAWGISQYLAGGEQGFGHGTYVVRNHFAGLLEMVLPFALAYGADAFDQRYRPGNSLFWVLVRTAVGFGGAAVMFAGIACSLSRMGLVATVGSICVFGMLVLIARLRGKRKWPIIVIVCTSVAVGLVFSAPVRLVLRFSDTTGAGRLDVWKDTLHLIAAYPLFGCGLGGYQAAFEKFKTTGFEQLQDYAHNDYLQFLAELGVVGFLFAGAFLLLVVIRAARTSLYAEEPTSHWLGIACTSSLAAILIHSVADFNLYVPANASLLAWVCGIATALPRSFSPGQFDG